MYLEAVTISVDYADFLREVIPYNLPLLDRWLIVTHPRDTATRELCRQYRLECLQTADGKRGGDFCKGAMIERGLQHLSANGWRLHVDADIALPAHFRTSLEEAHLQTDTIYGVDRIMVRSEAAWRQLQRSRYLDARQYICNHLCFPQGFDIGTRWIGMQIGYTPIGYFQLWHSNQDEWRGHRVKPHPIRHGSACRTDVQHALQWDRCKRALLPEVVVVHLESEASERGANWNGRTTKPFGSPAKLSRPDTTS